LEGAVIAVGASTVVVLLALAVAAFLLLRNRTSRYTGSEHKSGLAWRHHLGCSLADTTTTSSTIFLASDLCISIKHGEGAVHGIDEPANGPTTAAELVAAAASPIAEQVAASGWSDAEDAARLEILLLEGLWEISPDAEDDLL
jgi:hypothetical protein